MKTITKTKAPPRSAPLPPEAMDSVPRWTITITDERTWLTRHDGQGVPAVTYPVRVQDLSTAFHQNQASTGLIAEDVLFWQRVGNVERIGIYLPPTGRVVSWRNGKRAHRITVDLGFVFVGQGNDYWIHAAPTRPAKPTDLLYRTPLPNVYGDGRVCQGNVKFPRCAQSTIREAAKLFFESEFSDHLSTDKVRTRGSLMKFYQANKQINWSKELWPAMQAGQLINGGEHAG